MIRRLARRLLEEMGQSTKDWCQRGFATWAGTGCKCMESMLAVCIWHVRCQVLLVLQVQYVGTRRLYARS